MPVAGETVHVSHDLLLAAGRRITVRLRSKSCLGPVVRCDGGREKASSGREAANASAGDCGVEDQVGRTDSIPALPAEAASGADRRSTAKPAVQSGGSHGSCGHGTALRAVRPVPQSCRGEAVEAGEARPPDHAGPRRGRVRAQPAPGRPRRPARADRPLQGPGDPRRGRRRGQDGARSTWPWTRWPRRCGAPPTGAGSTTAATPRSPSGRRWPTAPTLEDGPTTTRSTHRPPGRADHGDRRRTARGAREDPPGRR